MRDDLTPHTCAQRDAYLSSRCQAKLRPLPMPMPMEDPDDGKVLKAHKAGRATYIVAGAKADIECKTVGCGFRLHIV